MPIDEPAIWELPDTTDALGKITPPDTTVAPRRPDPQPQDPSGWEEPVPGSLAYELEHGARALEEAFETFALVFLGDLRKVAGVVGRLLRVRLADDWLGQLFAGLAAAVAAIGWDLEPRVFVIAGLAAGVLACLEELRLPVPRARGGYLGPSSPLRGEPPFRPTGPPPEPPPGPRGVKPPPPPAPPKRL